MKPVECYVDIQASGGKHRIYICHDEHPCDATIKVDDREITPTSKMLPDGGALLFSIGKSQIIITIIKEEGKYDYDCFVDGKSVKNGMPWVFGKYDLPAVLKWKKKKSVTLGQFVLIEALKGALIGCFVYLILCLLQFFVEAMRDTVTIWYLFIAVVPLAAIYAALSPMEYRAKTRSLEEYLEYKNGKKTDKSDDEPIEEDKTPESQPEDELSKDYDLDDPDLLS